MRIKSNVTALDTSNLLKRIKHVKLYEYKLKVSMMLFGSFKHSKEGFGTSAQFTRGVIAQELQQLFPDAVKEVSVNVR